MSARRMMLIVAMIGIPMILSAAGEPFAGTWKLNVAKSTYHPGPPPQSSLTTYEFTVDGGMKVINKAVDAQGKAGGFTRVEVFDGKPHPVGESPSDAIAVKRMDPNTIEVLTYKDGKVIASLTRRVSKDGKSMTATAKGTNARGEPFDEIRVFDKQ